MDLPSLHDLRGASGRVVKQRLSDLRDETPRSIQLETVRGLW